MPQPREVQEFAAHLRMLKYRANRTYEALAKRTGISSSALHRYCHGKSIPREFAPLDRVARACGASREELRELQQRWFLADAARKRPPPLPLAGSPGPEPDAAAEGKAAADPAKDTANTANTTDTAGTEGTEGAKGTAGAGGAGGAANARPPAGSGRPSWLTAGLVAEFLVIAAAAAVFGTALTDATEVSAKSETPMLLSPACPAMLRRGEHGDCVRELQRLLADTGASIDLTAQFDPQTRSRVTAYQVLARIPPNGVVDERTKRALYDGDTKLRSWPAAEVEQRIREVFPEEPDKAVAIARCQSRLDPLSVAPSGDGSRGWGLFQIRDRQLEQLGGTPLKAFDPEWNIQAARRLWSETRDFQYWRACLAALESPTRFPPPPADPRMTTKRAGQMPQPAPRIPPS
jgi:transcriptional regulator with XRE-family HTH domain